MENERENKSNDYRENGRKAYEDRLNDGSVELVEAAEKAEKKHALLKKKRRRLFVKYIVTTMVIIVSFFTVSFVAVFGFVFLNGRNNASREAIPEGPGIVLAEEPGDKESEGLIKDILDEIIVAPRKTNVMLLGLDQSGLLSDVFLVASFDSRTKKIDVISIPRDTYVTLTNSQIDELNELGKYPPSAMKITELHSYAGTDVGYQYSMMKAEEMLGIEIDYYAEIKLDAFREIVDAVDGIEMDIPDGGLFYNDPEQNLTISVPEGRQLLDGEMAEGVVRYRATYRRGDMERIDVQKAFMKEFFTQVVNKETIMNNLMGFVGTMVKYVRTDFGPNDVPQYLTSLDGLGGENIRFHTLPGVPDDIGGISYYICDTAETDKLIAQTFLNYSADAGLPAEDTTAIRVQLLNGSTQTTISSGIAAMLEEEGYAVTDAGDYVGTKTTKTRILAKRPRDGESFVDYFNNAEVVLGEEMPAGFDVVVILGTSEY